MRAVCVAAATAVMAACGGEPDETVDEPVVIPTGTLLDTTLGPVRGTIHGGTRRFLGIPYARPPVGDRRWRSPEPGAPWTTPFDASAFGPVCPQRAPIGTALLPGTSEDCLTLNVWTPDPAPVEPRPILVWLHGGGFFGGSSSEPTYDGRRLVQRTGVVLVTVSYRVGPFGFLAHPALSAEDERGTSGNQGLLDQRLAVSWVRENALAFGGDPHRITLFGESAGGMSTCLHVASPTGEGLFARAIVESGPCPGRLPSAAEAAAQTDAMAEALGCAPGDLACLRAVEPDAVLRALEPDPLFFFGEGASYSPVIDGVDLPADPRLLLEERPAGGVPMLLGSNADDSNPFLALGQLVVDTPEQYADAVRRVFGADADAVLARFPATTAGTPSRTLAAAFSQWVFNCPTREVARQLSAAGENVFLYHFTYENTTPLFSEQGAFHGSELPFVFGTSFLGSDVEGDEQPLSDAMMRYWTRFAATGDPNGGDDVEWPRYDADDDRHLRLDLPPRAGSRLLAAECDFWRSVR